MGAPPPGMMWVPAKQPVTPLAKVGAVWLVVAGGFLTLGGLLAIVGGGAIANLGTGSFGNVVGGVVAVVGVILAVIGVLQILAGIGSWRGAGIARGTGAVIAVIFGLLSLAGAAGGSTDPTTGVSTNSGIFGWIVTIGYLYTAAVLIFFWKEKTPTA
jgi:hypothetical protein